MFEPKAKYISFAVMVSLKFLQKKVGLKLAAFGDKDPFKTRVKRLLKWLLKDTTHIGVKTYAFKFVKPVTVKHYP